MQCGDTITVILPKLHDLSEEHLLRLVEILSEPIIAGSNKYPELIAPCLENRAIQYAFLGELNKSQADLETLLVRFSPTG